MKKVTIKAADTKPENDKAKKLYRVALDIIRRLDEIIKQKKAFKDVFQPEATSFRGRLQDYCERLMFYDPAEYGRKAEELLWRKVYYDVIQLMKHNKKQMKACATVESAFKTHLCSATGYYHHLLFKLQCEYSLKLEGIVDVFHVPEPRNHKKSALWGKRVEPEPHVREWAIKACHRCLVYLGDIARYRQEYDEQRSCVVAQRYYYQALYLCPELGMPHNQLGTLAGTRCYNLAAIYHYLRCMVSPSSFEGAEGNLIRLFERNGKRFTELAYSSPRGEMPPEQRRSKDIRRFVVRFLHLCDVFVSPQHSGVEYSPKDLQDLCQATLNDFNLCMFYQPTSWVDLSLSSSGDFAGNDEKPLFLDDELIFKVAVISMISIQMQRQMAGKQIVAATAFSLAMFSHILNHVVIRLQSALYELENPRKVLQVPSDDDKRTTSTDFDEEVELKNKHKEKDVEKETLASPKENSPSQPSIEKDDQKKKKRMRRANINRRRRRRGTDSSTGSDQSHMSSDSDLSEGGMVMSGSETELNYLNHSESSDSETDDNLMVSQEMRPGFSNTQGSKSDESIQEDGTSLSHQSIDEALNQEPLLNGSDSTSPSKDDKVETVGTIKQDKDDSNNAINGDHDQNTNQNNTTVNTNQVKLNLNSITEMTPDLYKIADVSQYLQEFPVDWLSDSSNMFQQTLKFASLLSGEEISDVIQGKKEVRVPPGFEQSEESIAVQEITDKITNFNIETDTEANVNTDTETCLTTESEIETETETEQENVVDKTEIEQKRLERLLTVVTGEGLLATIKIYCDWMKCNPQVMVTCAKSSLSLWSRLSVLLNFLPPETELSKAGLCDDDELLDILQGDKSSQPLSEDIHLRCFPPLTEVEANLEFTTQTLAAQLDNRQEVMLRVYRLRQFGYFLSNIESIPLNFEKEKNMFFGPVATQSPEAGNEKAAQQQLADKQARRNQLMKDMAQLRLQAEVSQLEGSLCQSSQRPSLPPYLVPDATVLCDNLALLKQLAHCGRFIIIIPIAVIDQLDVLKKESGGAREAIRWLEAEFKKGNRYVRAQKQHEKTTKFPHKNMKKKDKDAWRYVQIVDCAKYLSQQSTEGEGGHSMVCVLTNHKVNSPEISIRVKQVLANAQQEGMTLNNATDFHATWKETMKSTSKG